MTTDWKASLPDDLKAAPALADVKDVSALAKAFVDTKALVGASIRPPGPDAAPEAHKAFAADLAKKVPGLIYAPEDPAKLAELEGTLLERLGRPKEPKGYAPPAGVELPEAHLEALRAQAAEEGLTARQFQARAKRAADQLAAVAKAQADAQAALKRELGAAYDERLGVAAAAADRLGFPKELVSAVKAGTIDLATFNALATVAKGFSETRQLGDQPGGGGGKLTPTEAQMQIAEIRQRIIDGDRAGTMARETKSGLLAKIAELSPQAYPETAEG